jgi:hypothetical protein
MMVFANYTRRSYMLYGKRKFSYRHSVHSHSMRHHGYIPVWFVGWKNTEIWIKPWLMGIIGSTKLVGTPLMFALVAMG